MSDLDTQLRRKNAWAMLQTIVQGTEGAIDVLDVGCGPGILFHGFSCDRIRVHGIDLSPEVVAVAARQSDNGSCFCVADATEIPFADGAMDVVTCLGVLEYLPAPNRAVAALARVLRPGGRLLVSFPNRAAISRTSSRYEIQLETHMLHVLQRARGRVPAENGAPRYAHQAFTLPQARRLLQDHRFEIEAVVFNTVGLYERLGRLRASLALSTALSHALGCVSAVARWLHSTMLIQAKRT